MKSQKIRVSIMFCLVSVFAIQVVAKQVRTFTPKPYVSASWMTKGENQRLHSATTTEGAHVVIDVGEKFSHPDYDPPGGESCTAKALEWIALGKKRYKLASKITFKVSFIYFSSHSEYQTIYDARTGKTAAEYNEQEAPF